MSDILKFKDRKFVAVLYPEDPTHAAAMDKLMSGGYDFAAILHDKDLYETDGEDHEKGDLKKPHWHVVIRFSPNALWNTSVAKDLGVTPNYLEKCRNLNKALTYLVHRDHLDKFQYDVEEVFGSETLKSVLKKLLTEEDEGARVLSIIKMVKDSPGMISRTEFLERACKEGYYGELRRMGDWAGAIIREHNDEIYAETRRCRPDSGAYDDAVSQKGFRSFVEGFEYGKHDI